MIGSFLTRGLVMVFGYAYPAYECYKTVEKNKPDIEQLRFWCQYWILVAMLTVFERVGDAFVSWVPMYSEAKLFFFIYLWYPQTKGTAYVYDSFFRPYVAKHETDIDRNLLELRTRAGDYVASNWQKAASYGQTRVFDVLQYIASQSTPRPRTTQPQQSTRDRQPPARQNRKPASKSQPQPEEPPSPASSTSSSEAQEDLAEEEARSEVPAASPDPSAVLNAQISTVTEALLIAGSPKSTNSNGEAMPIESASSSSAKDNTNPPPPQDSVMEDATRVTRARSRRAHAAASNR